MLQEKLWLCKSSAGGFLLKDLIVPWVRCLLTSPGDERRMSRLLSTFPGLRRSPPAACYMASEGVHREPGISFCQAGELPKCGQAPAALAGWFLGPDL